MAMRGAGRFPKRAGKEFVRNLIGAFVVYAPVAAFLTLWPVAPLGGVLIFGGIFLPAVAALITVAGVWAGRDTEAHDGDYDRLWGDGGYHYRDYPGSGEGGWYDGGGHHHGAGDGGAGDGGGGF
jgi:hypothetical protein